MRGLGRAALGLAVLVAGCGEGPGAGRLLVTSGFTDRIFVLDAATGAVLDSVDVDRRRGERDEPHAVAVAPDGRHWYATVSHGEPTLWKFETRGNRLVGRLTLPTRGASRVRLSPDGAVAAVPEYWLGGGTEPGRVSFVRTRDLTVMDVVEVCRVPHDAAFSPDGRWVAVTCAQGPDEGVVILDAESYAVAARHSPAEIDNIGQRPLNAAWRPGGDFAFISLMGEGAVVTLGPDGAAARFAEVGDSPAQLAVSPGGTYLVVANRGDGTASVLSASGEELHRVRLPGAHPHGVAFGPDEDRAYLTYEGDVDSLGGAVAIDLDAGRILWHTEVGVATLGIAYLPS